MGTMKDSTKPSTTAAIAGANHLRNCDSSKNHYSSTHRVNFTCLTTPSVSVSGDGMSHSGLTCSITRAATFATVSVEKYDGTVTCTIMGLSALFCTAREMSWPYCVHKTTPQVVETAQTAR